MLAAPASALADPDPETIVIIDRAPEPARDRDRALSDAPFVTIIHPDEHPATTSVADAVGQTVGAQTRSLGGLGAYESVSVRGAAPGHTAVLIDGVPLSRIAAVTTDLGRFALDGFGQIELYRGAVPVELGGAGVGGALDLVTRLGPGEHGERVTASAGVGSFGARHLRLHYGDDHRWGKSSTTIGYQGATGDYTYFDNGGTPLNPSDDTYRTRRNNAFDQLDAASRVGGRSATGGARIAWKHQGLPGSVAQPAVAASLATLDAIADGHGDAHVGRAVARELGYVLVERQRLADPMGELGYGAQDREYLTVSGGATSTWTMPIDRHRLAVGVELRGDRFRDVDASHTRGTLTGDREGGAGLVAVDLAVDPGAAIVVTPAVRFDVVRTAPTPVTEGPGALMPVPARHDAIPSPRLSMRAAIERDVSIKASGGWYVRLPTLIELFGDRGTIIGSPELRPERGPSGELGVVWAPAHGLGDFDRILVEADGFATHAHDAIALVSSAGFVARALNVSDTETWGGELVASARLARIVSLTASYTRLVTTQISQEISYANKALPRAPGHALYARADAVRSGLGSIWLDAAYQSDSYLDQANLLIVPGRVLIGAGARAELGGRVGLAVSVANLADTRVSHVALDPPPRPDLTQTPTALADVAGFPLPGRSYYVSLDWSH